MQNTTGTSNSQVLSQEANKSIVIDCDLDASDTEKPELQLDKVATQDQEEVKDVFVSLRGDEFSKHMNVLHLLRDSDRKEIRTAQPRICLKCWQIVCEGDSVEHPRPGHVLTGPFEKMQPANADSMYGLAKTRSRVGANDSGTVQTI